jgi:hypothetical protein
MECMPEVVEVYRDYAPPKCVRRIVDDLLKAVPPRYLTGLQAIVLTNQAAQTRDKRRKKVWRRNRKVQLAKALGYYSPASRSSQATISLHVDNIFQSQPSWTLRVPFLRFVYIAPVLYHEIGHHIHAVHRPIYEGKENVADDWSRYLSRRFYLKHYWYAQPILYPMWLLIRLLRRDSLRSAKS